ncbi:MAG: SGNH/GDSL hydrolase family protein [Bacteroidota bacterium]
MKKTSHWSGKKLILFSLISISLALLIVELICRGVFWLQYGKYHTTLAVQWNPRWISDTNLIWTNRPYYLESTHHFQHNEVGMRVKRGDVIMPVKQENDYWVFLFGGSAMAGMGSNKDGEWLKITGVYDHPINESIDGYLEKMLQSHLKNKRVRVFNAAVSGHSIYQSRLRYLSLKKYKPDWIISMDGVNEPYYLNETDDVIDYLKKQWDKNPAQNFIETTWSQKIFHTAFYFLLNRSIYNFHENTRVSNVHDSLQFYQNKWVHHKITEPHETLVNSGLSKAIDSYSNQVTSFISQLESDKQKYLLLLQPHLSLRDTGKLRTTEKATYNYYLSLANDTSVTFLKLLYKEFHQQKMENGQFCRMQQVHKWQHQVFVDYCHFSKDTNKKIAMEICNYIISNGKTSPFE